MQTYLSVTCMFYLEISLFMYALTKEDSINQNICNKFNYRTKTWQLQLKLCSFMERYLH